MKKKVIMIAGIFLVVAAAFMIYFIFSDSSAYAGPKRHLDRW